MCLLWQGFFFVFLGFAFWHLTSSSAFPSDLIFLWQAGIGLLWSSSSSSSSSCLGRRLRLRLSRSAFSFGFIFAFVFAFVWVCPSIGLLVHPHLVSSPSYSRSKSQWCCLRLGLYVILFIGFLLFHSSSSSSSFTSVLDAMFLPGVRLTCAYGHKKSEVEFQLCRCAFPEPGCTQVQSWPGPSESNSSPPGGPYQYHAVPCSTTVLRSTSCLGGEWVRRVLNIRATNPTPECYRRNRINTCSLYVANSVYMPYKTLTPHKTYSRPRIHP